MSRAFRLSCLILAVVGSWGLVTAWGQVVVEQVGAEDPEANGRWEAIQSGNASGSPAPDGEKAWRVTDAGAGSLKYRAVFPSEQMARAREKGWKLSMQMRIPADDESNVAWFPIGGVVLTDPDSGEVWSLRVRLAPDGSLLMTAGGRHVELRRALATDYHLSELVFDPHTRAVSLIVDGEEILAGLKPAPAKDDWETSVVWGAMAERASSTPDYRLVRFEILP